MKTVNTKEARYIVDEKGKKVSVILSIRRYRRMLLDLQELEDIRLYDEAKAKKEKSIPFNQYLQRRRKSHA
jgi:hypothetical protein